MKNEMKQNFMGLVKGLMFVTFTITNLLCASIPQDKVIAKNLDTTLSVMNGLFIAHNQSAKKLYSSLERLGLREDVKTSLFVSMVQQDELPKVSLKDDLLVASYRGRTLKASFKDAHLNRFIVDSKVFHFQPEKSFEQNLKNLMKVLSPNRKVSYLQFMDIILPQAHAMGGENGEGMSMTNLLILGAVVIGGIFLFCKINNVQKTTDANSAAIADIRARQIKDHEAISGTSGE